MTGARTDNWNAADSYQRYMGRWSDRIARHFVAGLTPPPSARWLDIGCGTGALTAAVLERCAPRSVDGVDPSVDFLARARVRLDDDRVTLTAGDAAALPFGNDRFDLAVSALALNFVGDRRGALGEMRRVVRPGGTIAFYVWDYPAGGVGFIDAFWKAAARLDPAAATLDEAARFPFCTETGLRRLCDRAGLEEVTVAPIVIDTRFADFADFLTPFTLGAGPAPAYYNGLDTESRAGIEQILIDRFGDRGPIVLQARAWGVEAVNG